MKKYFLVAFLIASMTSFGQNNSTSGEKTQSSTYIVSSIPYLPPCAFNIGKLIMLGMDDVWSDTIPITFPFQFFDLSYNYLLIGGNGLVTFDTSQARAYCPYVIAASCPSPSLPRSSIYGPFHDIDLSVGGSVYDTCIGIAPNRVFIISFFAVPMFYTSCNWMLAMQQIALYETSNIIDVYIQDAPLCTSWNSGSTLLGIQDSSGTIGYTPPGRNTGAWSTVNEAWRFSPGPAGINTEINSSHISLFPNPANESLTLTNLPADATIELYDAIGKKVFDLKSNNSNQQIDISHLNKGLYCLIVYQNGNVIFREKLVKK